jgi:CubicO group peptidase (beta-lactamase class C family)
MGKGCSETRRLAGSVLIPVSDTSKDSLSVTHLPVLELFSQTKLVTCLAALQLVDQGLVKLDSEEDIEKHLPEIGKLELLKGYGDDGKPILEKPKNKVTLRMLMSHTAGKPLTR